MSKDNFLDLKKGDLVNLSLPGNKVVVGIVHDTIDDKLLLKYPSVCFPVKDTQDKENPDTVLISCVPQFFTVALCGDPESVAIYNYHSIECYQVVNNDAHKKEIIRMYKHYFELANNNGKNKRSKIVLNS